MATQQFISYDPAIFGNGVITISTQASLPTGMPDGTLAVTLDTDTVYVYNAGGTTWYAIGAPGDVLTASSTNSITLTNTANNLTGAVRLSANAADAGSTVVNLDIESTSSVGLRAQILNSAVRGLLSATSPVSYDNTTGIISFLAPGTSGNVLTSNGSAWVSSTPTAAANRALSNLSAVAINTALLPASDGGTDIGSSSFQFENVYARTNVWVGGSLQLERGTQTPSGIAVGAVHNNSTVPTDLGFYTVTNSLSKLIAIETGNGTAGVSGGITLQTGTSTSTSGDITLVTGTASGTRGTVHVKPELRIDGTTSGYVGIKSAAAPTSYTVTLPSAQGASSTVLTNDGSGGLTWAAVSAGANTALSNLASVAINTTLLPGADNTIDAGSSSKRFKDGYFTNLRVADGGVSVNLEGRKLLSVDNATNMLDWSGSTVIFGRDAVPISSETQKLGSASKIWLRLYIDDIFDNADTLAIRIANGVNGRQLIANDGSTVAATWGSGIFTNSSNTQTIVTTQFDKTNTTLANVTGLTTGTLVAGGTYQFTAALFVDSDVVGGQKYAIAGTATATSIIYNINALSNASNVYVITSRQTALAGSAGQAGSTGNYTEIIGTIKVNVAGTLTVQFAQNAANGTSSVLVGSTFNVIRIS